MLPAGRRMHAIAMDFSHSCLLWVTDYHDTQLLLTGLCSVFAGQYWCYLATALQQTTFIRRRVVLPQK